MPIEKLCTALADEHDVPRTVSVQVMGWFGDINELEGRWTMNVDAVVREAGLGILKESKVNRLTMVPCPKLIHCVGQVSG